MKPRSTLLTCLASFAMLALVSPVASAAQANKAQGSAATAAAAKSAQIERTQMSRAFSSRWSTYVQRVYGVDANVWVQRMAPNLATADAGNLRNALQRDTFQGAMAELGGAGAKLSDDQVISFLAASKDGNVTAQTLGSLSNDLVYTPIQPCRIIDTRNAEGTIAANTARSYDSINSSSFTFQGGSATDCGTLGLNATAVAVNLTAVAPAGPGFATVYPFGTTQPLSASLNFAAGAIVNNALIIQIPNPLLSEDFNLFTSATSHYVADIVGYFAPPVATALQCESVADTTPTVILPGAVGNSTSGSCSAGYTIVGGECNTGLQTTRFVDSDINAANYNCEVFNGAAASNENLTAVARCCRVPGR